MPHQVEGHRSIDASCRLAGVKQDPRDSAAAEMGEMSGCACTITELK